MKSAERLKFGQEEYTSSKWSQLRVKRVKSGKGVKSGQGESNPGSENQIRAGRIKSGQMSYPSIKSQIRAERFKSERENTTPEGGFKIGQGESNPRSEKQIRGGRLKVKTGGTITEADKIISGV